MRQLDASNSRAIFTKPHVGFRVGLEQRLALRGEPDI